MDTTQNENNRILSIQDTNVLKGIAILLMLIHHLFYIQDGLYDDIFLFSTKDGISHYLYQEIGIFSKLCVAIFVFLSGYGLMAQAESKGGIGSFREYYLHRFKKLFYNYWFYWLTFVPVTIFVYGYSLSDAYHTRIGINLFLDVLGVHTIFIPNAIATCYNPSWWFFSCIIVLYLFFPAMYNAIKKYPLALLLVVFALSVIPIKLIFSPIKWYVLSFALGMGLAIWKLPPPSTIYSKRVYRCVYILLLVFFCAIRNFFVYRYLIDILIVLCICQLYKQIRMPKIVAKTLYFLGLHSMDIFLFHVFIIWWFKDFIYASRIPIVIFFTLLAICIPISILLEWIKKYTIYKL